MTIKQNLDKARAKAVSKFGDVKRIRSLAGMSATGEPQRSYMFEVGIKTTTNASFDKNAFFNIVKNDVDIADNLRFFAKGVNIPHRANEPIKLSRVGSVIQYPGKDTSSKTVTIQFWDSEELQIMKFFHEWYNRVNSHADHTSLPLSMITKDLQILLKDGSDLLTTGEVLLSGCFPIELSDINLSYDESGIIEQQVVLVYTDFELKLAKDIAKLRTAFGIGASVLLR